MASSRWHLAGAVGCLSNSWFSCFLLWGPHFFFHQARCSAPGSWYHWPTPIKALEFSFNNHWPKEEHVTSFHLLRLKLLRNYGKNVPSWLEGGEWWERPSLVISHFFLFGCRCIKTWSLQPCQLFCGYTRGYWQLTGRGELRDRVHPLLVVWELPSSKHLILWNKHPLFGLILISYFPSL